jgi:hypothetical protein
LLGLLSVIERTAQDTDPLGNGDKFRHIPDLHFLHHLLAVGLDRPLRGAQGAGGVWPRTTNSNTARSRGNSLKRFAYARGDLSVKHSRKSRSITSWVSISVSDAASVTIEPGRHACSREIPQGLPAVIDGLETWRRIEA